MASMDEYIDQLLAEMQTPEPLHTVVQNIMDEPIPEAVKRRLLKPLLPGKFRPFPETSVKHPEEKEGYRGGV